MEASGRKLDSDLRWVVPHRESEKAQRVESVGEVGTESGKQDDEAVGRRERPAGTKGSVRHSENYDWEGIGDIVDGYEDTEEVENEKEEKDIYYSHALWEV